MYHNNLLSHIFCKHAWFFKFLLLFVEISHCQCTPSNTLKHAGIYTYSAMHKHTGGVVVCVWTPWLHPTPEYLRLSFSDWPTFTHTWLIVALLSDEDSLSLPLFSGNKFVYLVAHCYYLHISLPILRIIYLTSCAVGEKTIVSLSLLWQHRVTKSHKCWYFLISCGLRGRFVVQFTATRRPTKVQEVTQGLPHLTGKKQALRKTLFSGVPWRETTWDKIKHAITSM